MDQAKTTVLKATVPPIAGLTFDAETHTYRYQGVVVPSVTQLLKPIENWDFLDDEAKAFYSDRGTKVHKATALDDLDDLDEQSLDPALAGYVKSWRLLVCSIGMQILSVEEQVYHPLLNYAGTMDRRALIRARHSVIDIKAGTKLPSHGVQTAGYRKAWNAANKAHPNGPILDCYTAYLDRNGAQGKLVPWPEPIHDSMFVALLTEHTWRAKYAA